MRKTGGIQWIPWVLWDKIHPFSLIIMSKTSRVPCYFNSGDWCDYSARKGGERSSLASLAEQQGLEPVLQTMASDEFRTAIQQQCESQDPHCKSVTTALQNAFCEACRRTVQKAGATRIKQYNVEPQ
ncbi:hypothetical protein AUJ46_05440 [Candidatus Peregrinibacteria bacterium CG1_02_54_53]|nr:MAG: hypothetical protein AUJ46_05440 [Candidatus Peregrinibacteria bacterium CG1_02_54_53]